MSATASPDWCRDKIISSTLSRLRAGPAILPGFARRDEGRWRGAAPPACCCAVRLTLALGSRCNLGSRCCRGSRDRRGSRGWVVVVVAARAAAGAGALILGAAGAAAGGTRTVAMGWLATEGDKFAALACLPYDMLPGRGREDTTWAGGPPAECGSTAVLGERRGAAARGSCAGVDIAVVFCAGCGTCACV